MQNYDELKHKADNGDTLAQLNLAEAYFNGDVSGSPELGNGMHYMGMAASSGNAKIQHMYASMLAKLGLEEQAFMWYEKAALNDCPESQAKLSLCYYNGTCTSKNDKLALKWAQQAYKNGDKIESCYVLGFLYLEGNVVRSDAVQAYKMFKEAAMNGDEDSINIIRKLDEQFPQLRRM